MVILDPRVVLGNWDIDTWTKWLPFCRQHFQMHFLEWKLLHINSNFSESCLQGSSDKVVIGYGNGLILSRHQSINWISGDLICLLEATWILTSLVEPFIEGLTKNTKCLILLALQITPSQETTFNSLWPSDAIWWQKSQSTLAQVMACCLMAPSHYQNQWWLIISEVQWHSY